MIADGDPVRQKACCRKTAPSAWPNDHLAKGAIMKRDICGQDVENSEDLQKHQELAHPMGVGDTSVDNLEKPPGLGLLVPSHRGPSTL